MRQRTDEELRSMALEELIAHRKEAFEWLSELPVPENYNDPDEAERERRSGYHEDIDYLVFRKRKELED